MEIKDIEMHKGMLESGYRWKDRLCRRITYHKVVEQHRLAITNVPIKILIINYNKLTICTIQDVTACEFVWDLEPHGIKL